jgi:hypothetical protein
MSPTRPLEPKPSPSDLELTLGPVLLKHGLLEIVETLCRIESSTATDLWYLREWDGAAEALSCAWLLSTLAGKLPGTKTQVSKARRKLKQSSMSSKS